MRVRIADEILADAVDVLVDDRVVDELGLALDFGGELFAEGDFAFERVEIYAVADVAVADGVHVLLGALLDGRIVGLLDGLVGRGRALLSRSLGMLGRRSAAGGGLGVAGLLGRRGRGGLRRLLLGAGGEGGDEGGGDNHRGQLKG